MDRRLVAALLQLVLLAASLQQRGVRAYGAGAPSSVKICTTMVPGHRDTTPQTGPSPFTLAPARNGVARGEPLNLTITSRHGFNFKGYIVQARVPDTQLPIGTFAVHDPENAKTLACLEGADNAITHTNPSDKNSTTFEWIPPADFNGPVVFNATVVQDYNSYWTGVVARVLVGEPALTGSTAGISTTQRPVTTQRTSTTSSPVTLKPLVNYQALSPIYDGCGSSKACFGFPGNCESNGNCNFMVTVAGPKQGDKFVFELLTSEPGAKYVAVGLSNNQNMDEDLVTECIENDSNVSLFQSWNLPGKKKNERLPTNVGLELKDSSWKDGTIYCKFERAAVIPVKDKEFRLKDTKYYLLLATGSSVKSGNEAGVGYHDLRTAVSGGKGFLSDVTGFKLASTLLLRLHGAFMIGAWIGAASIGIVLARYFKQTWTGSQLCGKDHWFAWHRFFMVLVWSLTIAAFVLIFVELKAWSSESKHAILGVITTALAFFQPIGALFRPSPDSRRRPIFNWLHWFVGNSAHILAIVTIFLAGNMRKAELPSWWIWIMVGYVAFHVVMHLLFSIAGCISERQSNKRINSFPMKEMSNSRTPLSSADRKQEAPHSCFRKFLLALYILGILVVTIALIVIAVLPPIEENISKLFTT